MTTSARFRRQRQLPTAFSGCRGYLRGFVLVMGTCFVLVIVFLLTMSLPAGAQGTICGPRPGIIEVLKSKFSEEQNSVGFVNQTTVFELYVSAEGSWTMLATNTAGISCIIGSGTNWQVVVVVKGDPA